jgi:hypothetical protein
VVWNETDVHVLIVEGLRGRIAQVLKVGGLPGACTKRRKERKNEYPKTHPRQIKPARVGHPETS